MFIEFVGAVDDGPVDTPDVGTPDDVTPQRRWMRSTTKGTGSSRGRGKRKITPGMFTVQLNGICPLLLSNSIYFVPDQSMSFTAYIFPLSTWKQQSMLCLLHAIPVSDCDEDAYVPPRGFNPAKRPRTARALLPPPPPEPEVLVAADENTAPHAG